LFRKFVLMPLLLLYIAVLIMAAWRTDLSPLFLRRLHVVAFEVLESVGFKPGMRVFGGSANRLPVLTIARCTIVDGIDATGRKTRIYPTGPCPQKGLRWKPVVYEHMIVHWTAWLSHGDYTTNLSALGDHFCQRGMDRDFTHVELRLDRALIDYSTGERLTHSKELGRVECRPLVAGPGHD